MFHRPERRRDPDAEATARWVYRLAYFLLADRRDAVSVLYQAVSRLSVTALTQKKRQAKRPKAEVHKKLSLTRPQLLQYLLYVCAEPYERMQEQEHRAGERTLSQEDMIARYVKHLVLLYLERNSFYATVGHSCVLFDLRTSQAERLYETLVQGSPAHLDTKGDYSVRDAKRELRQRLADRFGEFVSQQEGARREQRFVTMADAGTHFGFVRRCLHRMQPVPSDDARAAHWHLPAAFDPTAYGLAELQYDGANGDPRAEQSAELRRLHVVVHPCCWSRLLRASGHAYNRRRLLLPSFNLGRDGNQRHMPRRQRHPPELTSDDLDGLSRVLEKEARRRSALFTSGLTVAVDGVSRCRWSLEETDSLRVAVGAGARVLSISGRDEEGEVLLALYLLQLGRVEGEGAGPSGVTVESGREFTFTASRTRGGADGVGVGEVLIRFREAQPHRVAVSRLTRRYRDFVGATFDGLTPPAGLKVFTLTCAALLAALLFGWWLTRAPRPPQTAATAERNTPTPHDTPHVRPPSPPEPSASAPPNEASGATVSTPRTRPDRTGRPSKPAERLPRAGGTERVDNRRVDERRPPPDEEGLNTRGERGDGAAGVGLADVRKVYVDPLSGSPFGDALQRHLAAAVGESGGLSLAPERMAADAVIVGEVAESAGRLTIDLRLVNVRGRVLWRERMSVVKDDRGTALPGAAAKMLEALLRRIRAEARRG